MFWWEVSELEAIFEGVAFPANNFQNRQILGWQTIWILFWSYNLRELPSSIQEQQHLKNHSTLLLLPVFVERWEPIFCRWFIIKCWLPKMFKLFPFSIDVIDIPGVIWVCKMCSLCGDNGSALTLIASGDVDGGGVLLEMERCGTPLKKRRDEHTIRTRHLRVSF